MQTSSSSWHELLWGRNGLRSFALAGGVALHAINIFIATTILPSVVQDIGGLEYYAWNTTLFVAASILGSSCAPIGIRRLGLRMLFLLALGVFASSEERRVGNEGVSKGRSGWTPCT